MLVINMLISAVILFAIPAAIIAIIGGAMWYLSGLLSPSTSGGTTSMLITHTLVYLNFVLMV